MQNLANAGVGAMTDAQWWEATDGQGLVEAFDTIINGVRSCVLDLTGEMVDGKQSSCDVSITAGDDVSRLDFEDPDGWQMNSPSQIELVGDACASIKTGNVAVSVSCPCDAFIILE